MENTDKELVTPDDFPFPFVPYDIQLQFMKSLYLVLQDGKLGIFESPTGTGKSLSIICGALKWLKDQNSHRKRTLADQILLLDQEKQKLAADDDWFTAQSKEIEVTRKLNELKIEEKVMLEYEEKIEKIKNNKHETKINFKKSKTQQVVAETTEQDPIIIEDEDILLDENIQDNLDDEEEEADNKNKFRPIQIIIASRTHSQLSQFVGEIKKSPFADNIRVVSLASRQNYCINPTVKKLNNMTLVNEKCLDMQKKKQSQPKQVQEGKVLKKQKTSNCQCEYFKQTHIEELRDFALSQVHDIEDLVQVGQEITGCPYYASRKAAQDAEVVLVPYNTLLHKSTREANGINLKNNIVIIDEAHNLLEALAQMYGAELSFPQLYYSLHSLKCYKQRYNTMFSASTLRNLNQLIFVINKLCLVLEKNFKEESTEIFVLEQFVLMAGIEQYNFFNLLKFCKSSKISQKVRSYSLKYPVTEEMRQKPPAKKGVKDFLASIKNPVEENPQPKEAPKLPIPSNPLLAVISFLESLTYSYDDGRILLTKSTEKVHCKLQFLLLNPTSNFKEIIEEARSVIVAGGTMKPNQEFRDRLFIGAGASKDRIVEFSCDHIIPAENILPFAITKGLEQEKLLFNFSNRMSMGGPLQDIIKKACETVKGGIVVFFPSYHYENWVYEQIKSVNLGRALFREPQKSGSVDEVLEKYASTIRKFKQNAIMFSVVGGKLSEGLNFSDDLGRCVIVVGLPYANIMAADLKEKMAFLDKNEGQGAGQQFYENLCMKSVNQCIGRAVRHKNDYATVLLLDERYGKLNICNALPGWIRRSLKVAGSGEAFSMIDKFFAAKNN
ncbi:unnamed protein product [Ceutorhynchus assimilis]|uniref:Helicase ATP-binding domain-containing protein n=1 Tax=Ceutorhynchus assimilis TaxID=467358 RepID=A0A9N9MKJ5_9CUCU|nr:unnamed protein product [Ceutorhynchus assimilis]